MAAIAPPKKSDISPPLSHPPATFVHKLLLQIALIENIYIGMSLQVRRLLQSLPRQHGPKPRSQRHRGLLGRHMCWSTAAIPTTTRGHPSTLTNTHGITHLPSLVYATPRLSFSTFRETDDYMTTMMTQQESLLAETATTKESILDEIRRATYREIHRIVASDIEIGSKFDKTMRVINFHAKVPRKLSQRPRQNNVAMNQPMVVGAAT